jgi:mRNA-degrading endonuclease RelE of RelBE toxin-antitoxin system
MPFTVKIEPSAVEELRSIRVFDRRQIEQAIDDQLSHEPTVRTRNRKMLGGVRASSADELDLPLWELRVGQFRVLYVVDEETVLVRRIFTKPPHQTTEQVL